MSVVHWMLFFAASAAAAQTLPLAAGEPAGYNFDGQVSEWKSAAPAALLNPATAKARKGRVWIRQVPAGILVAGEADGGTPDFAASLPDMTRKDHVEIWIAPQELPRFPEIAWGNQFGMQSRKDLEKCEAPCKAWFDAIPAYRRRLERTFLRQYLLAPAMGVESYAGPAFDQIAASQDKYHKELLAPLKPAGAVQFKAAPAGAGYSFEALVPWEALPPVATLELKSLRLRVDVFSAHAGAPRDQPYSSTSSQPKFGDSSTFATVTLAQPRRFRLTGCSYPLRVPDFYREPQPGWFTPRREDRIDRAFSLVNEVTGYAYQPQGLSPVPFETTFYEKALPGAQGALLCGAAGAYHAASGQDFRFEKVTFDRESLQARAEPGGWMVRNGPRLEPASWFGTGQCGACSVARLEMYWLDAGGQITPALSLNDLIGNENLDVDIQVSNDWRKVTLFRQVMDAKTNRETWSAEMHCRTAREWKPCGRAIGAAPPKPRTLQPAN